MLGTQGLHPPRAGARHPRPAAACAGGRSAARRRACPAGSRL